MTQWWWVGEKLFVKTDCHRLAPLSTRLSATNRQQHWHSWNHNDDDDDDDGDSDADGDGDGDDDNTDKADDDPW